MTQMAFNVTEMDYLKFKSIVGDGQMSNILRMFVQSYSGTRNTQNEIELIQKAKKLDQEINELQLKRKQLQLELDNLENQRRIEHEKQRLLQEQEERSERETEFLTAKAYLPEMIEQMEQARGKK